MVKTPSESGMMLMLILTVIDRFMPDVESYLIFTKESLPMRSAKIFEAPASRRLTKYHLPVCIQPDKNEDEHGKNDYNYW